MNTRSTTLTALIAGALIAACQPQDAGPPPEPEPEPPDLAAINEAYDAATNAMDAEAYGMLYAEDAISMPPNEPPLVGRAAIVAKAAGGWEDMTPNLVSRSEGSYMMGDLVADYGSYRFSGTNNESGDVMTVEGKYVAIFKQQADGSWQIIRDIWNNNGAPTMEEGAAEM